jgi:hypothetical protein
VEGSRAWEIGRVGDRVSVRTVSVHVEASDIGIDIQEKSAASYSTLHLHFNWILVGPFPLFFLIAILVSGPTSACFAGVMVIAKGQSILYPNLIFIRYESYLAVYMMLR